ncbi:hypothetical protein [Nostoc sp. CHAB 5715]|uniref:hypothetical protein n=1 Tax=Nostoc sp. CHAB 5715 TaxID=2780400 RepID=UPI001E57EB07|nr:hypothetical protein [Nostoc sp. CHAB 5715]MCC5623693.1 hypothetical protein [Nostoc sp. CHAB 5715]
MIFEITRPQLEKADSLVETRLIASLLPTPCLHKEVQKSNRIAIICQNDINLSPTTNN